MSRHLVAGMQHETNTFSTVPTVLEDFKQGGGYPRLCEGNDVFQTLKGTNTPASGYIAAALERNIEVVPLIWASASPAGRVTDAAYGYIKDAILSGISRSLPADAIYLDLHGAMVTDSEDDGDGALIKAVRELVGNIPLIATLDLHANVSTEMVRFADCLIAYRTYPHVDMSETGARAFRYAHNRTTHLRREVPHFKKLPFLIPVCWQATTISPAKEIYSSLISRADQLGLNAASFCMGFPAADVYDCGPSLLAYGKGEAPRIWVEESYDLIMNKRHEFDGVPYDARSAVRSALDFLARSPGPVVIADVQDNPGAGSSSDSTGLLRALLSEKVSDAAIGLIIDPLAMQQILAAGPGKLVRIALGGKSGIRDDAPLSAEARVQKISMEGPIGKGPYSRGIHLDVGPAASVLIDGVEVVVASKKAQMADQELFRFVGIEPREKRILVVKSTAHFRADFEPIARKIIVAYAPAVMKMDPMQLPWTALNPDIALSPRGPTFRTWRESQQNE